MSDANGQSDLERLLGRYQPVGPAEGLRGRVLAAAGRAAGGEQERGRWRWRISAAVAAAVIVTVGLRAAVIGVLVAATLATTGKGY